MDFKYPRRDQTTPLTREQKIALIGYLILKRHHPEDPELDFPIDSKLLDIYYQINEGKPNPEKSIKKLNRRNRWLLTQDRMQGDPGLIRVSIPIEEKIVRIINTLEVRNIEISLEAVYPTLHNKLASSVFEKN